MCIFLFFTIYTHVRDARGRLWALDNRFRCGPFMSHFFILLVLLLLSVMLDYIPSYFATVVLVYQWATGSIDDTFNVCIHAPQGLCVKCVVCVYFRRHHLSIEYYKREKGNSIAQYTVGMCDTRTHLGIRERGVKCVWVDSTLVFNDLNRLC